MKVFLPFVLCSVSNLAYSMLLVLLVLWGSGVVGGGLKAV